MAVAAQVGSSVSRATQVLTRLLLLGFGGLLSQWVHAAPYYLIVSGLGGEPDYAERFVRAADELGDAASRTIGSTGSVKILSGESATRDALSAAITELAESTDAADTVAVFLIGHGSYDGEQYKYNLPGPDITGAELGEMLAAIPATTQLVVNTTSASGAVLEDWTVEGRTLITATRSGAERNATRFATYWAEALSSGEADLNKNGTVTAQEAYDFTARKVADSFEADGALATEHPQLVGDSAGRFNAARLVARPTATSRQRELTSQLEGLEGQIEALRGRRDSMTNDEYLNALQGLLVELAIVQRQIDEAAPQ